MTKLVAIYLFPGVEELDAVGPWEVLAWWTSHFDDGWRVTTVSDDGRPVLAAKGMTLTPLASASGVGQIDVLVYPGGQGTRALLTNADHLAWVRGVAEGADLITSVCTGALVLAAAGLLEGRPATTHWGSLDRLAQLDPTIDVRPDDRFVDDGDVITSAGVSAGIDMALHLVARLGDLDHARATRRGIQYDPQPPV